jgi:hypothetical protein
MKLISTYGHDWKHTNVQLVSLACGLALAAVAIVGSYELLRDKDSTVVISNVTQPAGLDIESVSVLEGYLGQGQLGEGVKSVGPTLIDPEDFGSLGIESMLAQSAYPPVASVDYSLPTTFAAEFNAVPQAAVEGLQQAQGIGQPGEGTQSAEATLFDPTDFGSLGIESVLQQSSYLPEASVDYSLPTTYFIEGDIRLP